MATVRDVVNAALSKLRVVALGDEATATEADFCLDEYNQMMHAFELDGMNLAHVDATLSDTVDVPDSHIEALKLSLMERIAGTFGKEMTVSDRMMAEAGRAGLRAYHFSIYDLGSDHPLSGSNLANGR